MKCRDCKTYLHEWCVIKNDSPDPDIERTCDYFMNATNSDRIRAMTDEELAKKISGIEQFALTTDGAWPPEKWLDWLKQEATE